MQAVGLDGKRLRQSLIWIACIFAASDKHIFTSAGSGHEHLAMQLARTTEHPANPPGSFASERHVCMASLVLHRALQSAQLSARRSPAATRASKETSALIRMLIPLNSRFF